MYGSVPQLNHIIQLKSTNKYISNQKFLIPIHFFNGTIGLLLLKQKWSIKMDNQNNYPMFPIPVPIPVPMPGPYYPPYGGGYGPGFGHGGGYGPGYGHGGGYGPGYGHGGGHMGGGHMGGGHMGGGHGGPGGPGGHMGGGRPRISLAEEDKQALRDEIESLKIKLDDLLKKI